MVRPPLVLILVTVLWASTFIVTKDVVRTAPPILYLALRFSIGTFALLFYYQIRAPLRRSSGVVRDGVIVGLLNVFGVLLQTVGQAYTTASKSSFITALSVPLTPVVAYLLYRSRAHAAQQVAIVMASIGVALLTYPGGHMHINRGDLYTLGCAVFYAFTIVEMAHRFTNHDPHLLAVVQVAVAAVMFSLLAVGMGICVRHFPSGLPVAFYLEARPLVFSQRLLFELAYMAIICTGVTFAGQTWALCRMSAIGAAVIFALEPVFATAMAVVVDGAAEWPGGRGTFGALLVLLAIVVAEIRLPPRRALG